MKFGTKLQQSVPPMTPGTKIGICVGYYGIGEQQNTYNGKTSYVEKVLISIEFPSEKIEIDGEMKPRQLSKTMTRSDDPKSTFYKTACAWFAKKLAKEDIKKIDDTMLLRKPCMVTVKQGESGTSYIESITQCPEGVPVPQTESEVFSFDVNEWNDAEFEKLPEWVQERIKKSTQYQKLHAPETEIKVEAPAAEGVCPI